MSPDAEDLGPCPICGRPMVPGASTDRHHWVPRKEGGSDWSYMHRICHKKLHSLFTERELAREYASAEQLLAHPDIAAFVKWVRRQPLETVGRHRAPARRR